MQSKNRSIMIVGILFCSAALAISLAGVFNVSHAAPATIIAVSPGTAEISVGETISVSLVVSDVVGLYGVSVTLLFDPAVLEVVDADGNSGNGVQITPGACPSPDFVVVNQANNGTGVINFDASSLLPSEACTGSDVIASVTFKGIGAGQSTLHYDNWLLADADGIEIPAASSDGALEVVTTTKIYFEPDFFELPLSSSTDFQVVVTDVANLYGVQLAIAFDPAILQVVDADLSADGVQITPGNCPKPDFVIENSADNVNGVITFTATSLSPSTPCNGEGTVATIEFTGAAKGQSAVNFNAYLLSDLDGFIIPARDGSGSISVIDSGILNGHLSLQGRTNRTGAQVSIWQGSTFITETITSSSGDFSFPLQAGTYKIVAEMNRYLDAEKNAVSVAAGETTTLSAVTLLGGDANEDDIVNILDLSLMGFNFTKTCSSGGWDPRADINNDCIVNIQDLTIAGGNFLKTSPVPWP